MSSMHPLEAAIRTVTVSLVAANAVKDYSNEVDATTTTLKTCAIGVLGEVACWVARKVAGSEQPAPAAGAAQAKPPLPPTPATNRGVGGVGGAAPVPPPRVPQPQRRSETAKETATRLLGTHTPYSKAAAQEALDTLNGAQADTLTRKVIRALTQKFNIERPGATGSSYVLGT